MTTAYTYFNKQAYHEQIGRLFSPVTHQLNRLLRLRMGFNIFFSCLAAGELVLFISFFALLTQSTILAFTLAMFFLTLFSYFVLRLYFEAKRPDQLMEICEEYLNKCRSILHYQEGIPEHHIALATAAQKLATNLYEKEYSYFTPPSFLNSLSQTLEKFSCFCYWKEFHKLKELLLTTAIEELIKAVKSEPTSLEVHAALANAYVMLSSLYADPRRSHDERWIPPQRYSERMQKLFRETAKKAIEEFIILNDYAPDDPWVHMQLAYSYNDLQMPEEEIREYEIVLQLRPDDQDTLFKLGILYFQQGKNAKGLHIYELLKKNHYKKAESLIKFYGVDQTV